MAKFTDTKGREWSLAVDTFQLGNVRKLTGFELSKLFENDLARLRQLGSDPELLCRVLFAICQEQATAAGVTEENFMRGMGGDSLAAAFDAFYEAFADFCPSQRRELLRALAKKERETSAEMVTMATSRIEAITTAEILKTLNDLPTDLPVLSESAPAG